jgi:lysozyme
MPPSDLRVAGVYHDLRRDLVRDEGLRLKPYKDSVGKLTIGVGRNLDDNGITEAEAMILLDNDIERARLDLDRNAPWWAEMPEPAMRGLLNMCFNLGWPRLSRFRKMLAALERGDWASAADQALDSRWALQVGPRATRIADLDRSLS